MTTGESFKRRVRARMLRTGERYTTARQALLAKAQTSDRDWVSQPEMSDSAVTKGTGHGWNHWRDLIDAWAVIPWDHAKVAARLVSEELADAWWAQTVTVGYERIVGHRLPHQMADGTFTANKSKTLYADSAELRSLLLDADAREQLFPGEATELRSKSTSKAIRLSVGGGIATLRLEPRADGKTKVTVQHENLPASADVEYWKFWWEAWLDAIDGGTTDPVDDRSAP